MTRIDMMVLRFVDDCSTDPTITQIFHYLEGKVWFPWWKTLGATRRLEETGLVSAYRAEPMYMRTFNRHGHRWRYELTPAGRAALDAEKERGR